ncbi:hypothetical protein [Microbulbifer epialgicus]|uniref:Toprim domain-containing protein n=1 Tax=Microbulbifer epialgicus TaxID=393907 RepID=A0ABV4NTU5_9GAMM
MNEQTSKYDWMLITIRGYDENKGYIYGNRHPDGKSIVVAKKHSVKRDWIKSLSTKRERTYAPPNSIVAIFGADIKDEQSGFTIASWATPISKDLGQEDVYVTPIKISQSPKAIRNRSRSSHKSTYIDATVLDGSPIPVRTLQDLQSSALSILSPEEKSSLNLSGTRGFMIRIGHISNDRSIEASSWEFFGNRSSSPEQIWNSHWNRNPAPGRQSNLLQAVLTAAQQALRSSNSYVEVVGLTKVLINDFGNQKLVDDLSRLPNYKSTDASGVIPSYSLAAIAVEKHAKSRIIKLQVPLPRNKVINHQAGLLGNHIPNESMPVNITAINRQNSTVSSPDTLQAVQKNTELSIRDFVNSSGNVNSFEIIGTKDSINKYSDRIENAIPGLKPFRVQGKYAYSFPIRFKKDVESSLYDLTGSSPLYIKDIIIDGRKYITLSGNTHNHHYRTLSNNILSKFGAEKNGELSVLDESYRVKLASELVNLERENTHSRQASTQQIPQPEGKQGHRSSKNTKISFSDWQKAKFGKDPYTMLDHLSGYIEKYATEAGIDWSSAKSAALFDEANTKGKLIKSADVRPISVGHRGSVAMSIHLKEKNGREPGDSIVWFKINFFNKKILKDDVITFDAYTFLKEEYDRDITNNVNVSNLDIDLEKVKQDNVKRATEAKERARIQNEKDIKSRNYWKNAIPNLLREDGRNKYWSKKGISHLLHLMEIRTGEDKNGIFSIYPAHDIDMNFLGAQRIYEKYWADEKGKKTNKNSIRGTLFKDRVTDQAYGTHHLIGTVDPYKPIIFCEGAADGLTNYAAKDFESPVVICFNKDNLYHVVGIYRKSYPETPFIISHDNDIYNKKNGNVGLIAALKTARDYDAEFVGPNFDGLDTHGNPTDFNDLHVIAGLDVVKHQIRNTKKPPDDLLEYNKLKIQSIGLDKIDDCINHAVNEIISSGSHGVDERSIYRTLLFSALITYSYNDLSNVLSDKSKEALESEAHKNRNEVEDKLLSDTPNDINFSVSITEETGSGKKKYLLIKDNTGKNSNSIEGALEHIVGANFLPFNEHLGGWVAPNRVIRLMNSYLYRETGSPRLYVTKSRSKHKDQKYVIRGDFRDVSFKESVYKLISYSNPTFKDSEYGFVLPDDRALPYIKESLRNYISTTRGVESIDSISDNAKMPIENVKLDEAVKISGQSRANIVLAHHSLLFRGEQSIINDDDFVFSAFYSRTLKSFEHLDPETRHVKAVNGACLSVLSALENEELRSKLEQSTVVRLKEIVNRLQTLPNTTENPTVDLNNLTDSDKSAFNVTVESPKAASSRIDSSKDSELDPGPKPNDPVISPDVLLEELNKKEISDTVTIENSELSEINNKDTDLKVSEKTPKDNILKSEQDLRINKLLEIVRLVVDKGFEAEDLYDHFIVQPGSPYFDISSRSFDDSLYRQDMKYLSSAKDIIGWTPRKVNSTSELFYAIYNDVSKSRVKDLESFINSYFGINGATTFKTFNKYLTGKQKLEGELSHPYLMEGEVNYDLISNDLEHLTDFSSIHELYRSLSDQYNNSANTKIKNDIFSIRNGTREIRYGQEISSPKDSVRIKESYENKDQTDINPTEKSVDSNIKGNLGQRFREWANRGIEVDKVLEILSTEYRMLLPDSSKLFIEQQYQLLLKKQEAEQEIIYKNPEANYKDLYKITSDLAAKELTYDDYIEDFFSLDGALIERNPYFSSSKNTINKAEAFKDLKYAGYKSLSQFYESIYQTINNRKSTDTVLHRVGGFIPHEIDEHQPIRPQFKKLDSLFSSYDKSNNTSNYLPPFKEWLNSPSSFRVIHPILSEDLSTIDKSFILKTYDRDSILLLADIHGVSDLDGQELGPIVDKLLSQWNMRISISNLSTAELQDLDDTDLTDLLAHFSIPTSGSHQDRSERLYEHSINLRNISKLRLAQYSYIQATINYHDMVGKVPNYAYRSINSFVHDENTLLDLIDSNLIDADNAALRKKIDGVLNVIESIPDIDRSLHKIIIESSIENGSATAIGINHKKESKMIYSDNYDKSKGSLSRYKYEYLLPSNSNLKNLTLPFEITHYSKFSDRLFGTATPIDIENLRTQNIIPISDQALISVCNPIQRWIMKYGYACFNDDSGGSLIIHHSDNNWHSYKIGSNELEPHTTFNNFTDFINKNIGVIRGFTDRDPVIEKWLGATKSETLSTLMELKAFSSFPIDKLQFDPVVMKAVVSEDPFVEIIGDNKDEDLKTKLALIINRLEIGLRMESWNEILNKDSNFSKLENSAKYFLQNLPLYSEDTKKEISIDHFYLLNPVNAIKIYDEYTLGKKSNYSNLFQNLNHMYMDTLSESKKKKLPIEIASGTYESLGHYLHEQAVLDAVAKSKPGALEIAKSYYGDSISDGGNDFTNNNPVQTGSIELKTEDIVLLFEDDRTTFMFGKIVADKEDKPNLHLETLDIHSECRDDSQRKIDNTHDFILVNNFPTPSTICSSISDVRDVLGFVRSSNPSELIIGHLILALSGLSKSDFQSKLEEIEPFKRVSPLISGEELNWKVSNRNSQLSESITFDSLVAALNYSETNREPNYLIDSTQVVWIESEKLFFGNIAGNHCLSTTSIPVSSSDINGRVYVKDIEANKLVVYDDLEIEDRFKQILSNFYGYPNDLIKHFNAVIDDCADTSLKQKIAAQILLSMVHDHIDRIKQQQNNIPPGYSIFQQGASYRLVPSGSQSDISLNVDSIYAKLTDLVRNVAIQQRMLSKTGKYLNINLEKEVVYNINSNSNSEENKQQIEEQRRIVNAHSIDEEQLNKVKQDNRRNQDSVSSTTTTPKVRGMRF